jgi:hypothetical protein
MIWHLFSMGLKWKKHSERLCSSNSYFWLNVSSSHFAPIEGLYWAKIDVKPLWSSLTEKTIHAQKLSSWFFNQKASAVLQKIKNVSNPCCRSGVASFSTIVFGNHFTYDRSSSVRAIREGRQPILTRAMVIGLDCLNKSVGWEYPRINAALCSNARRAEPIRSFSRIGLIGRPKRPQSNEFEWDMANIESFHWNVSSPFKNQQYWVADPICKKCLLHVVMLTQVISGRYHIRTLSDIDAIRVWLADDRYLSRDGLPGF